MRTLNPSRIRRGKSFGLGLALLTSGLAALSLPGAAQAAPPQTGVSCTTSASPSPNPTFTLNATDGYIQIADGTIAYMWGYAPGGGAFQHPGPVLCVNQGDTVTIVLNNQLTEPVSIMFPGQQNVQANGAPAQPQFTGANLNSLTNTAAPGGSVTYSFVADSAGSFIYESGTLPQKQVRMGLFGALVVRPSAVPTGGASLNPADYAFNRVDSQFTPSEEFMVLLSEIDPAQHEAAEAGVAYNLNNYQARYWLINGRGFPDSIADNNSPFLPDQPYGALARITPFDATAHPYPGAIRYLNVGTEEFPFHPHGNNGLVIGRDGRPLAGPAGEDLSFEKFAINIGPGQTWDVLFRWYDAEGYADEPGKKVPVVIPQVNNQEFGMFYSGSPYLGKTGTLPPGASPLNECGEFYIISNNHALFQITSWGVNMTGPITYMRIDPPGGCS